MDASTTHGAFSWNELCADDPAAAEAFYGQLFGWQVQAMDMGEFGTYRVAKVGDAMVAGIMAPPPGEAAGPKGWSSYVTVDDVDACVAQAVALGATVCVPAMDVPTVGRMATLRDPQGAMISVITYNAD